MIEEVDWRKQYYEKEREQMATHEMLAHALDALGGTLRINREDIVNGKFNGKAISYVEDIEKEQLVIRLVSDVE